MRESVKKLSVGNGKDECTKSGRSNVEMGKLVKIGGIG